MTSHESRSDRRESPLTQQEELKLTTDTILNSVEMANKLPLHREPNQSMRELHIAELPGGLKLPECWQQVTAPLNELTVYFSQEHDATHGELKLVATFGDEDDNEMRGMLWRPAQPIGDDRAFRGELVRIESEFGPRQRELGTEYQATASEEEVTAFIVSLIHAHDFQTKELPVLDPSEVTQAAAICDTLEYSLNAESLTHHRYDFVINDERYEIECTWQKQKVVNIQVGHVLRDDIVFEDGMPAVALDKLIAYIELDDFRQAIRFFTEMEDKVVEEKNVDPDMIKDMKRIIDAVLQSYPGQEVLTMDTDGDADEAEKHQHRYGAASPDIDPDDDLPPIE